MRECKAIERAFYDKFGVYPFVTFEKAESYGKNFLIWKTPTMCAGQVLYYKIGGKVETAMWFIEGWKYAPSALATFEDDRDKRVYLSDVKLKLGKVKGVADEN